MTSSPGFKSRGFIETALALLLLLLLLYNLYTVISVFLGVFTYAIIFSVALAKPFERLASMLNNKRSLAAFIYSILLIALIALPFIYIVSALTDYATEAEQWIMNAKANGVPALPESVAGLPFVGKKIGDFWLQLQTDPSGTIAAYEPKIMGILRKIVSGGAGIVGSVLELIVGIIISAVFLVKGEKILDPLYITMKNIVGDNGPALVHATGRAVKGVAVGVMGTAFIAALFAWIGFAMISAICE